MEPIISRADIERQAVDAADAGQGAEAACPWPASTEAAEVFRAAHQQRAEQLNLMEA